MKRSEGHEAPSANTHVVETNPGIRLIEPSALCMAFDVRTDLLTLKTRPSDDIDLDPGLRLA